MMKISFAALAGFLIGLLLFAVGREVWWAFRARPAGEVVSQVLRAVGSLKWIDTTLVTGLAAVAAAALSIVEIRRQIRASNTAVQQQIDHATKLEEERKEARRAANRAVLPLTLAALSQYAEMNARLLEGLRSNCVENSLPANVAMPVFADIPTGSITALKEMIETANPSDRPAFNRLLADVQVENSRLAGISQRRGGIITASNIDAHIVGQAALYARTAALYEYGRLQTNRAPFEITKRQVASGLFLVGVHQVREQLIDRYALESDETWRPYQWDH
ncbi:hypothetical protein [Rhizobium lentis]|uniref:hypothetical protein n=1 Tax=Rhizobium lentis TaxID=1138194 RepID=UPI001C82C0E0|nr:hypothetical protein [Rhizobium lentis]MBX4989565.1 hypothetical protein [Rhizobium lentis]